MPTIEQFLSQLLHSQQRLQQAGIAALDPSLVLGEALLRYRRLRAGCEKPPLQLVVTGPTQAGKSSVVNWLLGTRAAGVNALAGYTRHAQGFIHGAMDADAEQCMEQFFTGWQRMPQTALSDQQLDAWSLENAASSTLVAEQPLIVWDSPDFDSVSSRRYRNVVLKLLALADAVLLVVSKEKYADQTVWNTLKLIQPLQLPLLVCINKLPHDAADELINSLRNRLENEQIQATVTDLPYIDHAGSAGSVSDRLQQAVQTLLVPASNRLPAIKPDAFLAQHWSQWTAPVRNEIAQHDMWRKSVDEALVLACKGYQDNYLHAPLYAETMQQAVARLLELLEIPGMADTLGRARHVLTWPARKLRGMFSSSTVPLSAQERQSRETTVLNETLHQALVSLQHKAARQIGQGESQSRHWWSVLLGELNAKEHYLHDRLQTEIKKYQASFADNIEQAAQELYQHLQQHPAKLNSLRAARVTVDAAAVVLALKTGGIGLNDLVLTPAMLSFSSLLTEGAVGQYMQSVEKRLKQAQQQAVCENLLQDHLKKRLVSIPASMSQQDIYGITAGQLEEAERVMQNA